MPLRCLSQGMRVNIILMLYLSFLFCWWSAGVGDLALPSDTKRVTGKCSYRSLEKRTGDVDQSH